MTTFYTVIETYHDDTWKGETEETHSTVAFIHEMLRNMEENILDPKYHVDCESFRTCKTWEECFEALPEQLYGSPRRSL